MKRHYNSMEAELRRLRARGETGMSQGFEYRGRKRDRGFGMQESQDDSVSTWNLGDKRERNEGLRPVPGTRAGMRQTAPVRQALQTRQSMQARSAMETRPAAPPSARPVRKRSAISFIVIFSILLILITVVVNVFIVLSNILEEDLPGSGSGSSPVSEDTGSGDFDNFGSPDNSDPVFNSINYDLFFGAGTSEADPDEVADYADDFFIFDVYDETPPDELNYYVGSENGRLLIAFTLWSEDYDEDALAGLEKAAVEYMRELEPAVRESLDEEFGDGVVPFALTLYDFSSGRTMYILQDGQTIFEVF